LGNIELDFKPTVKVWDSNASLGPRHDFKVSVETSEQTLEEMDRLEIEKAIVYSPHAVGYDSNDGNNYLLDLIDSNKRLIPQFVFNPTWDNLEQFQQSVKYQQYLQILQDSGDTNDLQAYLNSNDLKNIRSIVNGANSLLYKNGSLRSDITLAEINN